MRTQSRARDLVVAGIALAVAMSTAGAARAQSTITISMTAAPAAPRLQAPFTFAARATTPLVFSIPATGQTPLTFSATGLPAGLAIAAATGIISGTMPAAGSYPVAVTVTNTAGSASATLHAGVGQHLRADAARRLEQLRLVRRQRDRAGHDRPGARR